MQLGGAGQSVDDEAVEVGGGDSVPARVGRAAAVGSASGGGGRRRESAGPTAGRKRYAIRRWSSTRRAGTTTRGIRYIDDSPVVGGGRPSILELAGDDLADGSDLVSKG